MYNNYFKSHTVKLLFCLFGFVVWGGGVVVDGEVAQQLRTLAVMQRGPGYGFQHPLGTSQLPMTPGYLTLSSVILGDKEQTWYIYINADNTTHT